MFNKYHSEILERTHFPNLRLNNKILEAIHPQMWPFHLIFKARNNQFLSWVTYNLKFLDSSLLDSLILRISKVNRIVYYFQMTLKFRLKLIAKFSRRSCRTIGIKSPRSTSLAHHRLALSYRLRFRNRYFPWVDAKVPFWPSSQLQARLINRVKTQP